VVRRLEIHKTARPDQCLSGGPGGGAMRERTGRL